MYSLILVHPLIVVTKIVKISYLKLLIVRTINRVNTVGSTIPCFLKTWNYGTLKVLWYGRYLYKLTYYLKAWFGVELR